MADNPSPDPFPLISPSPISDSFPPDHLLPEDHFLLDLDFDSIKWADLFLSDCPPQPSPPESLHSANYSTDSCGEVKSKWGIKRKKDPDEGSPISALNPRTTKLRRAAAEETNSSAEEEEKRSARLMRNRESAQLSRQRKKHYVEELEEKVRSMHSTIAELNAKISFFMNENASLKQRLGGGNNHAVVAPVHFPWIPFPGVAFRPQGSAVALLPLPKLKLERPPGKVRKGGGKSKKVASVSLLGFMFVMLICRGFVPRISDLVGLRQGSVFSVSGVSNSLNNGNRSCFGEENSMPFDEHSYAYNSSESLPAFLYVSRNGKRVKINGNLIINSVLASEKAVAHAEFRNQAVKKSAAEEDKEAGFEVPGNLASALALSKSHGSSAEHQRALAPDSEDVSKDTTVDGPLQQWFREGLAGPIFSSGTCTEVFQFEISPTSVEQSGIIPASSAANATKASSVNTTENLPGSSSHPERKNRKNRRFLYPRAIPLAASTMNYSEHLGKAPESNGFPSNTSATPMVVSILADPREIGDNDVDEIISPKKSISRIFVVVLLDSVKYVTYSCVLPIMSPAPHLVN